MCTQVPSNNSNGGFKSKSKLDFGSQAVVTARGAGWGKNPVYRCEQLAPPPTSADGHSWGSDSLIACEQIRF